MYKEIHDIAVTTALFVYGMQVPCVLYGENKAAPATMKKPAAAKGPPMKKPAAAKAKKSAAKAMHCSRIQECEQCA